MEKLRQYLNQEIKIYIDDNEINIIFPCNMMHIKVHSVPYVVFLLNSLNLIMMRH